VRLVYSLVASVLLSLVLLLVSLFKRDYLPGMKQRFGFNLPKANKRLVWVHAASVGEVVAAKPLIESLLHKGELDILVTTFTPSGRDQVRKEFADRVTHAFQPWDFATVVRRFAQVYEPRLLILMETEFWPNLVQTCQQSQIPVAIVNGRISDRAYPKYKKFSWLFRPVLSSLAVAAVQTHKDRSRYLELGVPLEKIHITGNTKFDVSSEQKQDDGSLKQGMFGSRPVWLAASTHQGEEEICLNAHLAVLEKYPESVLVLLPRHVDRVREISQLIELKGLYYITKSYINGDLNNISVILGDSMGEMSFYLSLADTVLMGGSLVEIGGHNPLEAIQQAKPVMTGPHTNNFEAIYRELALSKACIQLKSGDDLAEVVMEMLENKDKGRSLTINAAKVLEDGRGAVPLTIKYLQPFLGITS